MIVLSGASSTGKTMLVCDWCKKHPEYHCIHEVARDIMKEKNMSRPELHSYLRDTSNGKFEQFQCEIFQRQNCMELQAPDEQPIVVDRGPDPLVFNELHISHAAALKLAEDPSAKACLERYKLKTTIVVILCPLGSIEDDNVRNVPTTEQQLQFNEHLKSLLDEHGIPYKYCNRTDRRERMEWLEETIQTYYR